jgi:hypothetical protein
MGNLQSVGERITCLKSLSISPNQAGNDSGMDLAAVWGEFAILGDAPRL